MRCRRQQQNFRLARELVKDILRGMLPPVRTRTESFNMLPVVRHIGKCRWRFPSLDE